MSHGRHMPLRRSRLCDIFNRPLELTPIDSEDDDDDDDDPINCDMPSTSQSKRQRI